MKQPDTATGRLGLDARVRRVWLLFSALWILGTACSELINWDTIYPHRPAYLIALDEKLEKLVVWYADNVEATAEQFAREKNLGDVEQIAVGRNTLLVPANLSNAQKQDFAARARDMEIYLNERYYRGIAVRFIPVLLLTIFGPPLLLLVLARATRSILLRWLAR